MNKHILGTFDEALNGLRNDVITMGSLTARSLNNASEGLFQRSEAHCKACIADDEEIDELEKQIDRDGVELMLRFTPVASDLRSVISAMKVSSNLERIGDLAVGIARRALKLNDHSPLEDLMALEPAFRASYELFKNAMLAFSEDDEVLSRGIKSRDKVIDALCKEFDSRLGEAMVRDPGHIRGYMHLLIMSRNVERIADHATNIAEDTVYAVAAEDIRHLVVE